MSGENTQQLDMYNMNIYTGRRPADMDLCPWYLSGPAGTGKTESVKALGHQLGRFVLVFNCDETFDFQVSEIYRVVAY